MAKMGSVTVKCPVCGKDWEVPITGALVPRRGQPGHATVSVKIPKNIRIPTAHRSCIAKVH